jgi:hypothetical protein
MSEPIRCAIHDVKTAAEIAGPIFLNVLPRQGDVLEIDSGFHRVVLIEINYKTQDTAKIYVDTLGDDLDYSRARQAIAV